MNTATSNMNDNTNPNSTDVIDADVVDHNAAVEGRQTDWTERAPFTAAFLKQFDTARTKINTQLEAGQKNIDELQQKARNLVGQVQNRAVKVGEKVREDGKEATTRLDGLRKDLGSKFPLKIDLESWLNLPIEAREEVLSALGIATDRQVTLLQHTIDKVRDENIVLVEAQTAVLKEIFQANGATAVKPAAKAATHRPSNRKPAVKAVATKARTKTASKARTKTASKARTKTASKARTKTASN